MSPDPARTRFQALVEQWRIYSGAIDAAPVWEVRAAFKLCADDLSALLVQEAPQNKG